MSYYDDLIAEGVPDSIPKEGFAFEDLFDEYVASTQKTWSHDRSASVGASEAFGCIRKAWFSKRGKAYGYEPDAGHKESWGAMRRGDLVENYHVVPALTEGLRRRGMELIMSGSDQESIVDGTSSATSDGLVIDAPSDFLSYYGIDDIESDCCVVEFKSFDPRINIDQAKAIHLGQVHMQMGLIRETTDFKPMYAVVIYVNASWLDDVRCFPVRFDEDIYETGRKRNQQVFDTEDPAKLRAEGKLDGMCIYCKYQTACSTVSTGRVPAATKALGKKDIEKQDTALVDALNESVSRAAAARKAKKAAELDYDTAQEEVKQALIASGKSRAVGDGWKVSYTVVKGRKTLSKDLLVEDGIDPEKYMNEGPGYEKLTITVGTGEDA